VGNLEYSVTSSDLTTFFSAFGSVVDVSVPPNFYGRPGNRGYAFIEFSNIDEVKKAKKGAEGMELAGRALRLEWASSR